MIKYFGKQSRMCDMCGVLKKNQQLYLDDKKLLRGLFPEVEWINQLICTKCAKRETGKKWKEIKANGM